MEVIPAAPPPPDPLDPNGWGPDNPAPLDAGVDTRVAPTPAYPNRTYVVSEEIGRMLLRHGYRTIGTLTRTTRTALSNRLPRCTVGLLDELEADLELVGRSLRPATVRHARPARETPRAQAVGDPDEWLTLQTPDLDAAYSHLPFLHGKHRRRDHGV
ncbi:MAG: hypothetical protein AAFV53_42390 [Myxococcota bacterium]